MSSKNKQPDTTEKEDSKERFYRGNKTKHHPAVRTVIADGNATVKDTVNLLNSQETRSPLAKDNCVDGGDKSFAVRKTDLPIIRGGKDLEEGLLIYMPTTSPYSVYEILDPKPIEDKHGNIKVKQYSRSHTGEDPDYRSRTTTLHLMHIVCKMTYIVNPTPQEEISTYN